ELDRYNHRQLALMRNEIYAVHGYIFPRSKERRYFRRKKWYRPRFETVKDQLNDIELINLAKIKKLERTY
ncbi:MAG: YARHG domain-containing protein, partial [Bacteroidota bacterium]